MTHLLPTTRRLPTTGPARAGGVAIALLLVAVVATARPVPAQAATPTFVKTLAGPAQAAMYSSGLAWDSKNNRLVLADTGLDRVDFYSLQGADLGHFGTSGTGPGQFLSPRDAAVDPSGNIYIADAENNRIQSFDESGTFRWQAGGTSAGTASLNTPIGIDYDTANNQVLVADTGQSLIKAWNPSGAYLWSSPPSSTTGLSSPRDVTRGPDGHVWVSNYHHQTVDAFTVTPQGVWTPTPVVRLGTPDLLAASGDNQLNYPYNIDFSPDGKTGYIADTGNDRIARYDLSDLAHPRWLAPFGGHCAAYPNSCPNPPADKGTFEALRRVLVVPNGDIVGDDFWGNGLQVFDPTGIVVNEIEGFAAKLPGFAQPYGVATAPDGTVYVVDRLNQRIERFSASGEFLNATGSRGITAGHFSWPEAVAVAPDGSVWVGDTRSDRLQHFNADLSGTPTVVGGSGSALGKFNYIEGLAVDSSGKVWVADTRNNRIQVYDPATGTFSAFGGFGTAAGKFSHPEGIAVSSTNVYVADTLNNRIQMLTRDGTLVATFNTGLSAPEGIALASDGTVWVADTGHDRIVHLSANLTDLGSGFGSPGTGSTQFNEPHSLALHGTLLYVADTFNNRVQVYDTSGASSSGFTATYLTQIANAGGVAPLYPADAVADSSGNRYIADSGGSRIVKIDASGTQTTLSAAGWNDPRGIDIDVSNPSMLWAVDTSNSQVKELSTSGTVVKTIGGPSVLKTPYGLSNDATGVYVADTYNNRVVKLDKSSGAVIWTQSTCSGTAFGRPRDVAVGPDGDIYAADTDNDRIVVLNPSTGDCLRAFGSTGTGNGQFKSPRALTSDGANGLWIADAFNYRVQHVSKTGAFIASTNSTFGEGPNQFRSPACVFLDRGNLDVCDTFNYRIEQYTISAGGVPTFAGVIGGTRPANGGFNGAFSVAYAPSGELYAVDWFNHRIERFGATGAFLSQWGGYGSVPGALIFPRDVTVASDGTVVVTDSENNRIDLFTSTGTYIRSIKPTGTKFSRPYQTALDGSGGYWVADTLNNRVLHLNTSGAVLATLNSGMVTPQGVAVDASGNVYVSDTGNNRVLKFSSAGTLLATLPTSLNQPAGLSVATIAGTATLLIADLGNNRIVATDLAGKTITTFGSGGSGAGQLNEPRKAVYDPASKHIAVADFANNRVSIWSTTGGGCGTSCGSSNATTTGGFSSGIWTLLNRNAAAAPAASFVTFSYGRAGDIPVAGDWDANGTTTVGVIRGNAWYLRNANSSGPSNIVFTFGRAGDHFLVGDWDGNRSFTPGVRRDKVFYLNQSFHSGTADIAVAYGLATDEAFVGDWDGNGTFTPGVRRGNTFYLKNSFTGGEADIVVPFGLSTDELHVGDWNGDGTWTPGLLRGGTTWYLQNSFASGNADITFPDQTPGIAVVGNWDGR